MGRVFVLAMLLNGPVCFAKRLDMEKVAEMAVGSGLDDDEVTVAAKREMSIPDQLATLDEYVAATVLPSCEECEGYLIGNLLRGVIQKGHVNEITWQPQGNGSHLGVLTASLRHPVYGEIASTSRVPILWWIGTEFSATIADHEAGGIEVRLEDLYTEPPKQGMDLYSAMLAYGRIGSTGGWSSKPVFAEELAAEAQNLAEYCPSAGCEDYLERERMAAKYFMSDKYKSDIKPSPKKLAKVIRTVREKMMMNALLSDDNWASIFYSFISAAPKAVKKLVFTADGNGVMAEAEPNTLSSKYAFFEQYGLFEKAKKIGVKALKNTPKSLAGRVASGAASGWGFGMLFAHGDPEVADGLVYDLADPNNLVNLFSLCAKGEDTEDPKCGGDDYGRIHWQSTPPASYL